MKRFAIGVLTGLMVLQVVSCQPASAEMPNIVVILSDDAGWNSLSIWADPEIPESGSTYYQTPNMDRLSRFLLPKSSPISFFIFADDWGYEDLSSPGRSFCQTLHPDQMANG